MWSDLLEESLIKHLIFCAVFITWTTFFQNWSNCLRLNYNSLQLYKQNYILVLLEEFHLKLLLTLCLIICLVYSFHL